MEISDSDISEPRRPTTRPTKPINQDEIIIIDSDSEPSPPSKSSHTGNLSGRGNIKTPSASASPHKSSANFAPPGFRVVDDDVFEIISSDEEEQVPPMSVSASGSGRPKSPLPAVPPLSTPVCSTQGSETYMDQLHNVEPRLSPELPPALDFAVPPPSPPQIDMEVDLDFDRLLSPQTPTDGTENGLRHLSPRADSPIRGPSSFVPARRRSATRHSPAAARFRSAIQRDD